MKIVIGNVKCKIQDAPLSVIGQVNNRLSVRVPNYYFSTAYQTGRWDGYQRFLTRPANTFPTGLLPMVLELITNDMELEVELKDNRKNVYEYVMPMVPEDFYISNQKKARDYQVDTINKVITNTLPENNMLPSVGIPFTRGIINIATNGGKTVIAEGIIKQLYPALLEHNSNFLFVTHSKEIARQARKSIMTDLQIPVGMIGDGKWTVEPVTVAIVTTLYRRMKDERDEWNALKDNVVGFIADECLPYNTMVMLPDLTYKSIQAICADTSITEVMSYNVETKKMEPKRILRRIVNDYDGEWFTVHPNVWEVGAIGLTATKNHKVYTVNRGYVRLDELSTDDTLLRMGAVRPQEIHLQPYSNKFTTADNPQYSKRYNLEVEDNHNYFANDILVSNCHHSSSDSWYSVFAELPNAVIRLGLTGTIDNSKPVQELKLYACTGSVLNKVSNNYLISNGYSAKPRCIMFKVTSPELGEMDYAEAYQYGIVESRERNNVILSICRKEVESNNKVLILVEHIDHGEVLESLLNQGLNGIVYFTNGQLSSDKREELLDKMRNGTLDVLISSNILDEGIDISGINAIVYARGMKSMRKILQGIGRGLRVKSDGSGLRFYDFIDDTNLTLLNHSMERYKTLKGEKFEAALLTVEDYERMSWKEINGEE